MTVEELIKRIDAERKATSNDRFNTEGLIRLQEVAANYAGEYKLIWSDELLEEIKARPEVKTFNTGVSRLDELTGGFRPQQLITVSAATKHGKTTFGLFLVDQMSELNPVVIPLEQSNEEIVEQRHSNGYSIPRFLSPKRLASQVTVDWIEERVVEGIAKHNTKLVLIDHLGYINDFGTEDRYKRENLAYRIGALMQGLKNVAKRWNVVIVLLVHISQTDEGKPPTLQDLKGSSSIAQESDLVVMLWRKNAVKGKIRVYDDKTLVSVLANRRTGRNGNVGLVFNRETGGYVEDGAWVEAMERAAEQAIESDDDFETI